MLNDESENWCDSAIRLQAEQWKRTSHLKCHKNITFFLFSCDKLTIVHLEMWQFLHKTTIDFLACFCCCCFPLALHYMERYRFFGYDERIATKIESNTDSVTNQSPRGEKSSSHEFKSIRKRKKNQRDVSTFVFYALITQFFVIINE